MAALASRSRSLSAVISVASIERLQEKVPHTTDQAECDEMLEKIQRFKKRLEELRTVKKEQ